MSNENIRNEFSLDYCETLLQSFGMDMANAYREIFVLQRKMNKLQNKFSIAEGEQFSEEKYKGILQDRGIIYASEYKDYFLAKNKILDDMKMLRFNTTETKDENVTKMDNEEYPDEMPNTERKQPDYDIEDLRAKYKEKFGKDVPVAYKNKAERIANKIAN